MSKKGDAKARLNQAIARSGLCSRRKADQLIASGVVKVNGEVCLEFNRTVDPQRDALEVSGKLLTAQQFVYVAVNKPPGIVTTMSDERGRKTVSQLLPRKLSHLKPVGRLDMFSEGLLIMTNDGDLALRLTHPSQHLPKLYHIWLKDAVSDADIKQLRQGMELEDGVTLPAQVRVLSRNKTSSELEITLIEGRNRQLRRMFSHLGHKVQRLRRIAVGALQLGNMAPGSWRYLTSQEIAALQSQSTA